MKAAKRLCRRQQAQTWTKRRLQQLRNNGCFTPDALQPHHAKNSARWSVVFWRKNKLFDAFVEQHMGYGGSQENIKMRKQRYGLEEKEAEYSQTNQ